MNWIKNIWRWICGAAKTLLAQIADAILERAKQITQDKELISLALNAIQAAASEGLTGDKAWVRARDMFTAALKAAGRELGDCAIDTTLQTVYDAWKNRKD